MSRSSRLRPMKEVDRARRLGATAGERRPAPDPGEDRPLEAPQRRPRLDPERLHQRLPRGAVGGQRVRLPVRAVEREHELAAEPFRQRVLGNQDLELADELARAAEGELGVDAVLKRREAKLLEPADLALSPRLVGELDQRRAAPQRERLPQRFRRRPAALLLEPWSRVARSGADRDHPDRREARSPPAR